MLTLGSRHYCSYDVTRRPLPFPWADEGSRFRFPSSRRVTLLFGSQERGRKRLADGIGLPLLPCLPATAL